MAKIPIYKNKFLGKLKGAIWKEILFIVGYYMISNRGSKNTFKNCVY